MRIVFAEDQALLRKGLTLVLTDLGYEVVEVDNGPALVAALSDLDVDAAVVDVRLPPSQTTEGLAAAIEAREARPGLPVLVLSAHGRAASTPASCWPTAAVPSATC